MVNTKHTLSLTDAEAYILACVMGNLRFNDNPSVNSLLSKVNTLSNVFNIDVEDYDKVSAYVDFNGGCEESHKLCKSLFFTLDFDGSNVDLGENVEFTEETEKALLSEAVYSTDYLLYDALRTAIKKGDTQAVETYTKALFTLSQI